MHKAIQNFGTYQDDERVIDQVVKFNSEFYKLDLDINETIIIHVIMVMTGRLTEFTEVNAVIRGC